MIVASVSALGASPVRQREVLLARYDSPSAQNADRKGKIVQGGVGEEVCFSGSLLPGKCRSPRAARQRELTTGPAKLSSGRRASVAGSTRVMKSGVQCSRIAAMTEANERHRLREEGGGALVSPLGNARSCWRQRQRAVNQRAPAISFVARRGELPQIPDRKGNWTGCSSARSISSPGSGGRLATLSLSLEVFTLTPQWPWGSCRRRAQTSCK